MRPIVLLAIVLASALGAITPNSKSATTININPSKDNTLYETLPLMATAAMAPVYIFSQGRRARATFAGRCLPLTLLAAFRRARRLPA